MQPRVNMEKRGDGAEREDRTFRVGRRSCDQCRARKVGCDRGSPCSPCVSARLSCTHSAVASSTVSPKQRVLISAKYEHKIDGIAKDVDEVKQLLQTLRKNGNKDQYESLSMPRKAQGSPMPLSVGAQQQSVVDGEIAWGHSAHMIDFIRNVVRDGALRSNDPESKQVLSSLQKLLRSLEDPVPITIDGSPQEDATKSRDDTTMPPQDTVVAVLRWAKENASNTRISWLSRLLSLDRFIEICQNIYFSIHDYSEVDFILANGFLSYIFFEHVVVSGRSDYAEHSRLCRNNLTTSLNRLPLLIQSSMKVVAALALGAYNAVEDSKVNRAWTFISAASNHCIALGYHRRQHSLEREKDSSAAQERLFWAVYRLDKGISLRLGRSSTIRDGDISIAQVLDDPGVKVAGIQGRAYDELYSPRGLTREASERACIAQSLATELHQCVVDTCAAVTEHVNGLTDKEADPVGVVYMQCELICQYSLLTLIFRALPVPAGSLSSICDECLKIAREALRVHEECIAAVRNCKNEPLMLARYVNWAIVHCPFPPFSILLTQAIQLMDVSELDYLERFAASLEPQDSSVADIDLVSQPHQLYSILCKAARLYLDFNTAPTSGSTFGFESNAFCRVDGAMQGAGRVNTAARLEMANEEGWLGEWFYGNQLVMSVLDDEAFF